MNMYDYTSNVLLGGNDPTVVRGYLPGPGNTMLYSARGGLKEMQGKYGVNSWRDTLFQSSGR